MKTKIFYVVAAVIFNGCGQAPNEAAPATATEPSYQDTISYTETPPPPPPPEAGWDSSSAGGENSIIPENKNAELRLSPADSAAAIEMNKRLNHAMHTDRLEIIEPKIDVPVNVDTGATAEDAYADEAPTAAEEQPKNAMLGFSYFPQIPQNETRDLRVFVKVQADEKFVGKKLKEIEKADMEFTKTDDSSVVCLVKNIEAYKKLSIKPIYDLEDFRVTRVDEDVQNLLDGDPNEQLLDFQNGNYWHWKVKAIAKSAHVGNITLRIKAETPEGRKIQLAERQINIKIGINEPKKTVTENIYEFLDRHFKEILTLIIIPLAIYLFNIIRKRLARRNAEDINDKKP